MPPWCAAFMPLQRENPQQPSHLPTLMTRHSPAPPTLRSTTTRCTTFTPLASMVRGIYAASTCKPPTPQNPPMPMPRNPSALPTLRSTTTRCTTFTPLASTDRGIHAASTRNLPHPSIPPNAHDQEKPDYTSAVSQRSGRAETRVEREGDAHTTPIESGHAVWVTLPRPSSGVATVSTR